VNLRALALQHRHGILNTLGHLGICDHVLGVEAPNYANLQPLGAFLQIRREVHDRDPGTRRIRGVMPGNDVE